MTNTGRAHPSDRATRPTDQAPAGLGQKASVPCAFTKGPWVYKWFGGPQIGGGRNGATAICTLWGSWRLGVPTRQERANRDLICAAPDLYRAVELLLNRLEASPLGNTGEAYRLDGEAHNAGQAALAKAQGSQTSGETASRHGALQAAVGILAKARG